MTAAATTTMERTVVAILEQPSGLPHVPTHPASEYLFTTRNIHRQEDKSFDSILTVVSTSHEGEKEIDLPQMVVATHFLQPRPGICTETQMDGQAERDLDLGSGSKSKTDVAGITTYADTVLGQRKGLVDDLTQKSAAMHTPLKSERDVSDMSREDEDGDWVGDWEQEEEMRGRGRERLGNSSGNGSGRRRESPSPDIDIDIDTDIGRRRRRRCGCRRCGFAAGRDIVGSKELQGLHGDEKAVE